MKTVTCALLALLFASGVLAQIPDIEAKREFNSLPNSPLIYLDDTLLTVGEFGDYLYNSGVHPSGQRERDLDTLVASLDAYIDELIITRDLDSAAILSDPKSRRRQRWRMAHRAGPITYTRLVAPHVSVSQEEIEKFYNDSLRTIFTAPSKREVRQILVATKDSVTSDGKRVRGREQLRKASAFADSLKALLQAGARFDSLALAVSDDSASRVQSGYLGWIYPGNTVYEFDTAAFAAQVGEIRGPVKSMYGYHLIRVEQVRPESTMVLTDTVATRIRRQLEFTKGRALGTVWADSLLAVTDWRFNDSALALTPEVEDSVWMVSINSRDTLWYEDWQGAWEMYRRQNNVEGPGTLEDKHTSLKHSGFPYLYLQVAEDHGFDNDPAIAAEARQFLKSEAMRLEKQRLRELQEPPAELVDYNSGLVEAPEPAKQLHLQMIRSADTAAIWAAYRCLLAGDDIHSVARRYHDNLHEVRSGRYDLGWVGPDDLPRELWGMAWILESGRFTRPAEHDSAYYIFRLEDRYRKPQAREVRIKEVEAIRAEYRQRGLATWREDIRKGHKVRLDRSYWNRVQQLWRP